VRARISLLVAAILSLGGLTIATAAAPAQATVRPDIPTFPANNFTNVGSDRYLWLNSASGKFESFVGTYTTFGITAGTSQEYYDVVTGNCLTYHTGNYLYEKGCSSSAPSQLWKSTKQSNGSWIIKNNYLGTSDCLQDMGNDKDVQMEACDGGSDQQWIVTQLVGIMGSNQ